jgi:hypothetical protein
MTERRDLDLALGAAAVDTGDLDAARRVLLDRLTRRSNDFAATTALQALNSYSAEAPATKSTGVRAAGLSGVDHLRRSRKRDAA